MLSIYYSPPLPWFPRKKANGTKKVSASISRINIRSGEGSKAGIDLFWHLSPEYQKFTQNKNDELKEWYETEQGVNIFHAQCKAACK